jgi:hypothetical protein
VLYSWRYAAPSTINSLYLAQQMFRLFLSYSVQSGNSAVGLNSYWLIANALSQMSSNTVRAITAWSFVLLEMPPVAQLRKNFPKFCGTRRIITVFTRALHRSLS